MIYGYRMENGSLFADEKAVGEILAFTALYLEGASIEKAGTEAGLPLGKEALTRILQDDVYLGSDGYPAIFSEELAEKIRVEYMRRTHRGSRTKEEPVKAMRVFVFRKPRKNACPGTAAKTAEYIYSLIVPKRTRVTYQRAVRKWIEKERIQWLSESFLPDGRVL